MADVAVMIGWDIARLATRLEHFTLTGNRFTHAGGADPARWLATADNGMVVAKNCGYSAVNRS